MAHKVSIYLDDDTHRQLKTAASRSGMSLSAFMADAALQALHRPDRRMAHEALRALRPALAGRVAMEEIAEWRTGGRL